MLDVPEFGFFSTDKPYPRGEVCVANSNMISTYYNNPDATADAFVLVKGVKFYRTGDIAELLGPREIKVFCLNF